MRIDAVKTGTARTSLSKSAACLLLLLAATSAGAQAPATPAANPADPFEKFNRGVYRFNDGLDRAVAKPVAKAYRKVLPQPIRTGISNFLSNLAYPTTMVNNLLQGKFHDTANDFARIVFNTTIGIGGIFDPASKIGLARNNEDYGQTLGHWGVPSGPYLMLPMLGPSTLRDAPMRYPEYLSNGRELIEEDKVRYSLVALTLVDQRVALLPAEEALQGAFDPYGLIRNAYLQRREYQVRDGDVPDANEAPLEDPGEDDLPLPGDAEASAPPADPAAVATEPTPSGGAGLTGQ